MEPAEVAQLVEQLIRNQQVIGSSPIFGSILIRLSPNLHFSRVVEASHCKNQTDDIPFKLCSLAWLRINADWRNIKT